MSAPAPGHDAGNRQRKQRPPPGLMHPKPSRHAAHQLKISRTERALTVSHDLHRALTAGESNQETRPITRLRLGSSAASVIARRRDVASY